MYKKTKKNTMVQLFIFLYINQSISITMSDRTNIRWVSRQDHTSHCHFCSMIDEFPVWNSELIQPWWWVRQFLLSMKRFHFPSREIETLMIASFLCVRKGRECCLSGQLYIYRLSKLIRKYISKYLSFVKIIVCYVLDT